MRGRTAEGVVVPDYDLRLNGTRAPLDLQSDLRAIRVVEDVSALSMFELELENWDPDALAVSWSDSPLFAVGGQAEISLGAVDDVQQVMLGEITALEPSFGQDAPPTLVVRGHDHGHRLLRRRRSVVYSKMKDSAIAARLARESGLRAAVTDTKVTHETVTQAHETDLAFLRRRAARIGYEVFVRDKVLHFRPPAYDGRVAHRLDVAELSGFTARLSASGQLGGRTVQGWDPRKKVVVHGRSAPVVGLMGGRKAGGRVADSAFGKGADGDLDLTVTLPAEADQMARGRYDGAALGYVEGECESDGLPHLRAGTAIEITGAGKTFSGVYYVRVVRNSLDAEHGFRTVLELRRNAA